MGRSRGGLTGKVQAVVDRSGTLRKLKTPRSERRPALIHPHKSKGNGGVLPSRLVPLCDHATERLKRWRKAAGLVWKRLSKA